MSESLLDVHISGPRKHRRIRVTRNGRIIAEKPLPRGADEEAALLIVHNNIVAGGGALVSTNLDDKPLAADAIDWSKL